MSLAVRCLRSSPSKLRQCLCRSVSTTASCHGKKNFRKFVVFNRGNNIFRQQQLENPDPNIPVETFGVKRYGYNVGKKFVEVPEMIPKLIVPDLEGFKLQPYVSYRAPDVVQSEFSSKDLFDAVYARKVIDDFKAGKLDENGEPLEPSPIEKITAKEAFKNARKTGSDIF